jgi:hypothetical protein
MAPRFLTRPVNRWRSRARDVGQQCATTLATWRTERDIERVLTSGGRILVGPWCSEVGYELLYWVPFVRRALSAYRVPSSRVVAMSRGGVEDWYADLAATYLEVFDHATPGDLAAQGPKQRSIAPLDERLIAAARREIGNCQVLHPSSMFQLFAPFWSGHRAVGFLESRTRQARVTVARRDVPMPLPDRYIAVKLYAARALPDSREVRGQVRAIVAALSDTLPVVLLDTGIAFDEHEDYRFADESRVVSLRPWMRPRDNLGLQTRVIAGADLFVGTCGSVAWLAPLLGVDAVPLFVDAGFLHAHLHVARRTYHRLEGAGRFAPVDLSGLLRAGLAVGAPCAVPRVS